MVFKGMTTREWLAIWQRRLMKRARGRATAEAVRRAVALVAVAAL